MKSNAMRVRHAAKDLDAAKQYLRLAAATVDHAALILADEERHDPALGHELKLANGLRDMVNTTIESAAQIDLTELRGYTAPEPLEACLPHSAESVPQAARLPRRKEACHG